MATSVFGIAKSYDMVTRIVGALKSSGFADQDISVLMADKESTRQLAHEQHTKAPEGATTGAATGGVLGGTVGLLAGIGALAIPGLGPFIAAGPIMAALSGAAVGAAVGGLTGALIGMGIPEYEAKRYENSVKAGNALVSVHAETDEQERVARRIFEDSGAEEIASASESSDRKDGSAMDRGGSDADRTSYNDRPGTGTGSY